MKTRKPNRLREYDYSASGWYFVTICTQKHIPYFGKVENGKMVLNRYGRIVDEMWNWLPKQYSYCKLDEYVIMPNHFHGIIIIERNDNNKKQRSDSSRAVTTKILFYFIKIIFLVWTKFPVCNV